MAASLSPRIKSSIRAALKAGHSPRKVIYDAIPAAESKHGRNTYDVVSSYVAGLF